VDRIKFLGTAGARIVVARQIRASGGLWFTLGDTNFALDPGPGALVKALSSKPALDPLQLNAVILSHKHIDHSNDVNILVEAMTQGGFNRRGKIFAPADALNDDPVILKYVRNYVEEIELLEEMKKYSLGNVVFQTSIRHLHGVETYGMNFEFEDYVVSYIADTRFFPELLGSYYGDLLIINMVRYQPGEHKIDHLNVEDVKKVIQGLKPRAAVITHFGMTVIRAKPWEVAARLEGETGVKVIAARDGMDLGIKEVLGQN
jgi:phosphoribosyl 1,2-cyclic phosphodiesterase